VGVGVVAYQWVGGRGSIPIGCGCGSIPMGGWAW
jgi:hypothetical protein